MWASPAASGSGRGDVGEGEQGGEGAGKGTRVYIMCEYTQTDTHISLHTFIHVYV